MELTKIIGIGMIAAVLSLTVKQTRPEIAFALPILGAAGILFCRVFEEFEYYYENGIVDYVKELCGGNRCEKAFHGINY